ncbi:hypothetical protein Pfo_008748 [Paulownia fortunei]|nr:hypothetical protein Pfo_008748 [Paulownia fortunei]
MGEFLVFWFNVGMSTFEVSVFGINGCERQISACSSQVEGSDSDEDVELRKYCICINPIAPEVNKNQSRAYSVENEAGSDDGTQKYDYTSEEAHPHFKLLLKEHHRSRVSIRKEFAVAAGIKSEEAVVLQYHPRQRCWPVLLCHYPNLSQFRLDLAGGWNGFRRTNGLVFGKTYLFEYIPDKNVIMVKLLSVLKTSPLVHGDFEFWKPKTSRPSFFKVLVKDFTTRLSLPPVFVPKYGKILPESAKLRISSGETWDVKLEEIDDEKYCFTVGWNKFVKYVGLEMGEFLVFWFNGKSTFDVSVFGISGCEREVSAKNLPADSDADDQAVDLSNDSKSMYRNAPDVSKKLSWTPIPGSEAGGTDSGTKSDNFGKEMHLQFEIVLSESRRSRVSLRKDFAEAARLTGKRAVVLEYPPKQRYWPVLLDHRPPRMLDMAAGWHEFRKENGLVFGKTYCFEFIPTKNVIQMVVEKSGYDGKEKHGGGGSDSGGVGCWWKEEEGISGGKEGKKRKLGSDGKERRKRKLAELRPRGRRRPRRSYI